MIYLKALNAQDSEEEYRFFQSIHSENGFMNDYEGMSYQAFVERGIPERLKAAQGIGLKPGHVPDTYFFLWDDQRIVGVFKIRHYLNDFLRQGSGHIGYGILPQERHKGYGSKGLALALKQCQELMPQEETEIYLSCLKSNHASLQVMLKNGAYIHHEDEKEYYTRIPVQR